MPNPIYWFRYNGGPNTDPLSYTKLNQRPIGCDGFAALCAIFAESQTIAGQLRPIIANTPLVTEIPSAVNNNQPTQAVILFD